MNTDAKARRLLLDNDAEAIAAWRAQDPANDAALHDAQVAWAAIGRTRFAREEGWRDEVAVRPRRWIPAGAALAASLAVAAVIAPQLTGPRAQALRTDTGQTRQVTLADGSVIFVGARSAVNVKLDQDSRTVVLKDGEAFFDVASHPDRPFTVVAGDAVIRVTGTKFNVCHTPYGVKVAVLDGKAQIFRKRFLSSPVAADQTIGAGQQVRLDRHDGLTAPEPVNAEPGGWRQGRVQYADAPLKEVVADANRYSNKPIRLASSEIGDMRVTVSFRAQAVNELVAKLDAALPISARTEPDGDIVLTPEQGG